MKAVLQALVRRASGPSTDAPDADVVRRLSALPESLILAWFWGLVRQDVDRLWLLLNLGEVIVERPPTWDQAAVRAAHNVRYGQPFTISLNADHSARCFACDSSDPLYSHHAIEVSHGGSNTPRNLVFLCFNCHQYLHPWLKVDIKKQEQRRGGLESTWEIANRSIGQHERDETPK